MKTFVAILFLSTALGLAVPSVNVQVVESGTSPGGGSATNALVQGPAGNKDASLVTNVQGNAIVSPLVIGAISSGTISASVSVYAPSVLAQNMNTSNLQVTNRLADINNIPSANLNNRQLLSLTQGATLDWTAQKLYAYGGMNALLDWSQTNTLYVTNLNAQNVTGLVIQAKQFVGPISGTLTNNTTGNAATATNTVMPGTANTVPIIGNNFQFVNGGGPWVGDDHAFSYATLTGQPWAAMTKPAMFIWNGWGTNVTEAKLTNLINTEITNGHVGTLLSNGVPLYLYVDCNYLTGIRSNAWPYILKNWGTLVPNTANFPDGPDFIPSMCHSNGLLCAIQVYWATNFIPPGASSWIISESSANFQAYTNGTGALPSDTYGPYLPVITPEFGISQLDCQELALWGFDAIVLADQVYDISIYRQGIFCEQAMSQVYVPSGFNMAFPVKYSQINTNTSYTATVPFTYTLPLPMSYVLGKPPMASIALETIGPAQNRTLGSLDRQNHTAVFYDNNNQGGGATGLRTIYRDFVGQRFANQGGFVISLQHSDDFSLMADAISGQLPVGTYTNVYGVYNADWAAVYAAITNTPGYVRIWQDPQQNWFNFVQDLGTNVGSIWSKKLFDGSYAVFMTSEGSYGSTNFTINWQQLGFPSNQWCRISDAFYSQQYVATSTNQNSYSLTLNGNARLFLVEPLPLQSVSAAKLPALFVANSSPGSVTVTNDPNYGGTVTTKGDGSIFGNVQIGAPGTGGAGYTTLEDYISGNQTILVLDSSGMIIRANNNSTLLATINGSGISVPTSLNYSGNGSGLTNSSTVVATNWASGLRMTNTTTHALRITVPTYASQPATTLGRAGCDGLVQVAAGLAYVPVSPGAYIEGGATSILETNYATICFDVQPGWGYCPCSNLDLSGTGYTAGMLSTLAGSVYTNLQTTLP